MIQIASDGNGYISPFDQRLWNFTYNVLMKFGCPIQFKVDGPDVRYKMNQQILFFVPVGRVDVAQYIVQEWTDESVACTTLETGDWIWGVDIHVVYFDGPDVYMEQDMLQSMAQNMMLYLQAKLQGTEIKPVDFNTSSIAKH